MDGVIIRKFRLSQISTCVHSSSLTLLTVSMLPSSFSGSSGALLHLVDEIDTTTAAASTRSARDITDYHSVVTVTRRALGIATYNVHSCRGLDRRTRPERTAAVLRAIDGDIVA